MNPDEKKLLEATYELAKENNKILRSMRRSSQMQSAFKILYWVVIVIIAYYSYMLIQPYMNMLKDVSGQAQTQMSNLQEYTDLLKGVR